MHEQRLTDRLTNYWNLVRKDDPVPDFARFNISAIEDVWQQCILFTVQPGQSGNHNVNFYNVGQKVRSIYGANMLGHTVSSSQKHFQGASIVRKVDDIIANPAPLYDEGQFVNDKGKVIKYRSCLLPFGTKGRITHIVAGLSWREF